MGLNFATALADFIGLVQNWDNAPGLPTDLPPAAEPPGGLPGKTYLPFVNQGP